MNRRLVYALVSTGIILLDQLTKFLVVGKIGLHREIPIIEGFFSLSHVKNPGAAFGFLASFDSPLRPFLLNAVAIAVFFAVLVYAIRSPIAATALQTGLSLILGGAIGNLIDRLRFGSVTDFLHFYIGSHVWPDFNVADSAITIGVLFLAWDIWKRPHGEEPASSSRPETSVVDDAP